MSRTASSRSSRWRAALVAVPALDMPAFYISFLYIVFNWISLSTSWAILSGFAGYWSFGHAAFFGVGVYTAGTLAAKLGVPFLWTLPVAAVLAAALGRRHRLRRLPAAAPARRALRADDDLRHLRRRHHHLQHADRRRQRRLSHQRRGARDFRLADRRRSTSSAWRWRRSPSTTAYRVSHSRLGLGLFAIHDDEDVAEVKGVPTFRYKLTAFALSAGIAGAVGAVYSIYVSYVTVGETFEITVTMYPVVMTIFGGSRHWAGPALGAIVITTALYSLASGPQAYIGRAVIALGLILIILLLPQGVLPSIIARWRRHHPRRIAVPPREEPALRSATTRRARCSNAATCRRASAASRLCAA